MLKKILHFLSQPNRIIQRCRQIVNKYSIGSYTQRLALDAVPRPHYGYCVYQAAKLAQKLGHKKISILEFGVAGGNGLVNLEYHAAEVSKLFGIEIELYGFDTGQGLPGPEDYRDLPYHWKAGQFRMDIEALKARLKNAQLILGDIKETIKGFASQYRPAPIGAIMFDLDYYSSTVNSLHIFELDFAMRLPRIFCYLDDVVGSEIELYSEHTGVLLAIEEFNRTHVSRKIDLAHYLQARSYRESWYSQIRIFHDFQHPEYCTFISEANQQLKLE